MYPLENAMAKKGPWFCFYQKVWLGPAQAPARMV